MSIHVLAMLIGVFVVPVLLLAAAHRLRRRPPRARRAFQGAIAGHVLAIVIGTCAAMLPPIAWSGDDVMRGALALWLFLVLPAMGAAIGWGVASGKSRGN